MGGTSASSEETFDAAVLITIAGSIDGPVADLQIVDLEVVEALGSVDMGEINLDFGDRDEINDYNQLQLMLEAEEGNEGPPRALGAGALTRG